MKAFTTLSLFLTAIAGVSALPSESNPAVETTTDGDFTYIGHATVRAPSPPPQNQVSYPHGLVLHKPSSMKELRVN